MESNKFFVFVNRFNSIVFMMVLLAAGASIAYINIMSNEWRDKRSVKLKEGPDSADEIELILGNINTVSGSSVMYVDLREREGRSSYSSGGSLGETRNVLFFKDKELKPVWLFERNGNLIREMDKLKIGEYSDKNPVTSFLYEVVYNDTNGNDKLDRSDKLSIALSRVDGSEFVNVIESVDSLIDHTVSNDGKEIGLIYQKNHKIYLERVSLADFKSLSKSELTQIGNI